MPEEQEIEAFVEKVCDRVLDKLEGRVRAILTEVFKQIQSDPERFS